MKTILILLVTLTLTACGNSHVGIWSSQGSGDEAGPSKLLITGDGSAQHILDDGSFYFYSWIPNDKNASKGAYYVLNAVRSPSMAAEGNTNQPKVKSKVYALEGLTFIVSIDGKLYLDGKGIFTKAE